ncbi:PD-(D/E)XK motif protein [Nitrosospira sp. Nsp13]|uniref:PD-(D/E)XK motif protein n=1 Tax=Nitrosospira sp. Nsp13 TaxID=1855332 RepID=UPI0008872B2D|nr:PD-(D/E)XK motif protein [Nitrosospira sp. Nsp13]SCX93280.1 Putative PD-(D/E)XK family member [Nitrosospira sp. Nsp13]
MVRPIDEFVLAWNALSGQSDKEGWRTIPVAQVGPCVFMAGRRFPANEEALLVGFASASISAAEKLPEGRGFEVSRADPHGDGKTWIALTRKESGSVELFAEMVGDVLGSMDFVAAEGEDRILRTLLGRVRSWQEFMRQGLQALSPEAEIGLIGELSFLGALLEAGVPASLAVGAWVGPLDGMQDFVIGTGAIEVKATLSAQGFPAKIGSLEQLDDSVQKPLFVAGVRFSLRESGKNLPEFAAAVREALYGEVEASRVFSDRLLAAGFHGTHVDRYPRCFSLEETRVVEVREGFPRIVPGNVPDGIRRVIYEIDLDRTPGSNSGIVEVLNRLGAL